MKLIKKCPVFFLLAVSGLIFTLIGIAGRSSIYKEYQFNVVKSPFLSLMMEGLSSKVAPWEMFNGDGEMPSQAGQRIEDFAETPEAEEDFAAGGTTASEESTGTQGAVTQPQESAGAQGVVTQVTQPEGNAGTQENVTQPGKNTQSQGTTLPEGSTSDFQTVTEDYFDDAVFIGDSRTVGLFEYGGIEERADFFAKISLTIYDVFTEKVAKDAETGKMITVEEALSRKQYGKVYLMLGINELGTGTTETFMKEYRAVVERLQELQPDAVIFVEGIMRVTGTKNEADPIFNNTNINDKNTEIAKLADNKDIFYIDVNEVVCDAEGNLNADYTIDEIHLKAKYYAIWKQFLLEHGILR